MTYDPNPKLLTCYESARFGWLAAREAKEAHPLETPLAEGDATARHLAADDLAEYAQHKDWSKP